MWRYHPGVEDMAEAREETGRMRVQRDGPTGFRKVALLRA